MPRTKVGYNQDSGAVNALLDAIMTKHDIKNDAAFCRRLGWAPPQISKIRHGRLGGLSAQQKIDLHLEFDLTIRDINAAVNVVNVGA